MTEVAQHKTNELQEQKNIRNGILEFEDMLKSCEGAVFGDSDLCPVKHSFVDGMYIREIFIPAGVVLTGKVHKHSHPNFLMKGKVKVFTEFNGMEILEAPLSMISKAGTKRVVEAIQDTIWITLHKNKSNTQDLLELEKEIIAENYEEYEKFINSKNSFWNRMLGGVKNLLTLKKGG